MKKQSNKKDTKKETTYTHYNCYIGNKIRIIILVLLLSLIILLFGTYSLLIKNFGYHSYNQFREVSNGNFQVLQKDGLLYHSNYTKKYNSNLINKMDIDLKYNLYSKKQFRGYFEYKVEGKLKILNSSNKEMLTKTYVLLPEQIEYTSSKNQYSIDKSITFDYSYYYNLVNGYKINDPTATKAFFEVTLIVKDEIEKKESNRNNQEKIVFNIPLDNGAVDILINNIDKTENNTSAELIPFLELVIIMVISVLVLIIFILFVIYCIKQHNIENDMSDYDKTISKILGSYDRLIVNISVMPDLDDYKVSKVKEFKELVDAAKTYNEPIRYIEVTANKKSNFIVRHKDELFIYTITNKK